MFIFTILVILIAAAWFYWKAVHRDPRIVKMFDKFKGPPSIPVMGHTHLFFIPNEELLPLLGNVIEKYGRVVKLWIGNLPYLIFCDAESVEKIMSSNVFINKGSDYTILEPWLRTGLLTSNGQKWFTRRKLLTPTFHFKILEDFFEVFNEESAVLIGLLDKKAKEGKQFNISPFVTHCALDIICETAMGKKTNAQTQEDNEYVKAVYEMGDMLVRRLIKPWLRPDFVWKFTPNARAEKKWLAVMHKFTENVIAQKKAFRLKEGSEKLKETERTQNEDSMMGFKKRRAFLDLLLDVSEDGKVLTDLDIREEVDTFMFEGHDTTAANLSWTIHLLGRHPEYQAKVQEELDSIFGDDKERPATMKEMTQMKYLENCIKESLRLYPSVPAIARNIFQDLDMGDGRIIPKGTVVFISNYWLNRDPSVFPEPEKFIPERWSEAAPDRNPYAYVPFSAGARNCIGQKFAILEEKVVLSSIFRNFHVQAIDEKPVSVPDLILRPKDGILVKLSKR